MTQCRSGAYDRLRRVPISMLYPPTEGWPVNVSELVTSAIGVGLFVVAMLLVIFA